MQSPKHWQDPLNVVIAVVLLISPWVIGYERVGIATLNAIVAGTVLGLAALAATFVFRRWETWVAAVAGAWIASSPWLLGFATRGDAMIVAVGLGAVAFLLAASELAVDHAALDRLPKLSR